MYKNLLLKLFLQEVKMSANHNYLWWLFMSGVGLDGVDKTPECVPCRELGVLRCSNLFAILVVVDHLDLIQLICEASDTYS